LVIRRQLRAAARWLPLLLAGALLAAVPSYLYLSRQDTAYEASASLLPERLLPAASPDFNEISLERFVALASTWSIMATTPRVLEPVIATLGLSATTPDLAKQVVTAVDGNTAVLTVTGRAGSADDAVAFVNAIVERIAVESSLEVVNDPADIERLQVLRERILETQAEYERLLDQPAPITQQQQDELASTLALLQSLNGTYEALATSIRQSPDGLAVVDPAVPQEAIQTAPRALYYSALAAVVGLVLVAGIAGLLQYLDARVRSPEGVRAATGLVTLGAIRRRGRIRNRAGGELPMLHAIRSANADEYRTIRANVDLHLEGGPGGSILVAGPSPSRERSAAVANLAIAFAATRERVVLIDADLRTPGLHRLFGVPNREGLTTLLADPALPAGRVAQRVKGHDNLMLVTSGPLPVDPGALLGSEPMTRLIKRLVDDGSLAILDSAPLGSALDAAVLAGRVDATILAIDAAHDGRPAVVEACDTLERSGAGLIGAVLFSAPSGSFSSYRDGSGTSTVAEGPSGTDRQAPVRRAQTLEHADA
jgi:capsular exopolysaccharide synthesis family protein